MTLRTGRSPAAAAPGTRRGRGPAILVPPQKEKLKLQYLNFFRNHIYLHVLVGKVDQAVLGHHGLRYGYSGSVVCRVHY